MPHPPFKTLPYFFFACNKHMELKQVKTGKKLSLHVKTKMTGLLSR